MRNERLWSIMSRLVDAMDSKDQFILQGGFDDTYSLLQRIVERNKWKIESITFQDLPGYKITGNIANNYSRIIIAQSGRCGLVGDNESDWTYIKGNEASSRLEDSLRQRIERSRDFHDTFNLLNLIITSLKWTLKSQGNDTNGNPTYIVTSDITKNLATVTIYANGNFALIGDNESNWTYVDEKDVKSRMEDLLRQRIERLRTFQDTFEILKQIIRSQEWSFWLIRDYPNGKKIYHISTNVRNKYFDITIEKSGLCAWSNAEGTEWTVMQANDVPVKLRSALLQRVR